MSIDLTPVFQAIIALLAALVSYKVIPWLTSRTTAEQQKNMLAVVKVLVFAAEQLHGTRRGEEKLAYVSEKLRQRGYVVDTEEIEAAVKELTILEGKARVDAE